RRQRSLFLEHPELPGASIVAGSPALRTGSRGMTFKPRLDSISGPAFRLIAGRVIGGVVSFAIPVVLARTLLPTAFGTYKQLFLIYMTLYGVAPTGAARKLYY